MKIPACPEHKLNLIELPVVMGKTVKTLLACPLPDCAHISLMAPRRMEPQMRLGVLSGTRKQVVLKEDERAIQNRIVDRFRVNGYTVLETSERRKKIECAVYDVRGNRTAGCGRWFYPTGGRPGMDIGIPDLFVRHPVRYPPYLWMGIECKGTETPISDQQRKFAARMGYIVARHDEDAWQGIMWAEEIMQASMEQWIRDRVTILRALQDAVPALFPTWRAERLAVLEQTRRDAVQICDDITRGIDTEIRALLQQEEVATR